MLEVFSFPVAAPLPPEGAGRGMNWSMFMYTELEEGVVGAIVDEGVGAGGLEKDGESWLEWRDPGGVPGGRGCGMGDVIWGFPCCDASSVEGFWLKVRSWPESDDSALLRLAEESPAVVRILGTTNASSLMQSVK